MAEFLIYNKDHWSKAAKLTPEQVEKFKGCYVIGDVVEVREDGYWDKRGFNKEAFRVVKNPGLSLKDTIHYMEPLERKVFDGIDTVTQQFARRKYQITNPVVSESKIDTVAQLSISIKQEKDY